MGKVTRRAFTVGAAGAAWLGGCATTGRVDGDRMDAALQAHLETMDLASTGLVVRQGGRTLYAGGAGFSSGLDPEEIAVDVARRPFQPDAPFRVASMSKAVVGLTALRLSDAGLVDLDADVSDALGFELRHPEMPSTPITLSQLLSHTSGIRDSAVYWVPAPGSLADVLQTVTFIPLEGAAPGTYFEYANLNTGIAATVLEAVTGERFDRLADRVVLSTLGLDAGFNWSDVSLARRRAGATLYRRGETGEWSVQIDGPDGLMGTAPTILAEAGFSLDDYAVGSNGTLFSPQGGLRASLTDLAVLAGAYAREPELLRPRWTLDADRGNGDHQDDFFQAMGLGVLSYPAERSPFPNRSVYGHHGEAYGLHGAFWILPDLDAQIAYSAVAIPEGAYPPAWHPGLNTYTAPLAALAADVLGLA